MPVSANSKSKIVEVIGGKGGLGVSETIDATTDQHFPLKKDGAYRDSNITQDPDGKVRVATQLIAEGGVDTPPGTITIGDGLDVQASGSQAIFSSRVTDQRFQSPYQLVDKDGISTVFQVNATKERHEVRQKLSSAQLTSPAVFTISEEDSEIINAVYLKTNGTVKNLRYQAVSVDTGHVVDSYPTKFAYIKGEGVTLSGAGVHKLDLYYVDQATPNRFSGGQEVEITLQWENDSGTLLGSPSGAVYYEYDFQVFSFVNMIPEAPQDGKCYCRKDTEWVEIEDPDREDNTGAALQVYYTEDLKESSTHEPWETKARLELPLAFEAGTYFIEVGYCWKIEDSTCGLQSRIKLDSFELGTNYQCEKQDGSQGIAFLRFKRFIAKGVHAITFDFGFDSDLDKEKEDKKGIVSVWDANITVTKIKIMS